MKIQDKVKTVFILLFFWQICSSFTDSAKELTGVVTDAETSKPLTGVTVLVKGTNKGAATDANGHFSIKGLSVEKCILAATYLSYKTVEIECNLNDNITHINIALESDDINLSEVVVSARVRSNTETSMITTVKSLPQVVSGISAAQIAQSPDRVASEVVRRIPGITVLDDRF
ncbi:MAG: TonB-dependent receptor, partial [Prevotellaceae bacterium]|nr:TonB-dependent receptor [Prevotellaceae bacterium]